MRAGRGGTGGRGECPAGRRPWALTPKEYRCRRTMAPTARSRPVQLVLLACLLQLSALTSRVSSHTFPSRLTPAQLRRGLLSGGDRDPKLVALCRRLRRGEPLVAALLGGSITRDYAGDCGRGLDSFPFQLNLS